MLKALIPVELTLASNISLRYLCQKASILNIEIQPIRVEELDDKPHSSQTGWIRKSWESGVRQAGLEEVLRILRSEKLDCSVMPNPIVKIGSREDKLLEELRIGKYDLYVEGEVANYNTNEFYKKLRSKFYRQMPCPALIVRNMIQSDKVVLLLDEKTDLEQLIDDFSYFFTDTNIDFDVCGYSINDLQQHSNLDAILDEAFSLLKDRGYKPGRSLKLLSMPKSAAQTFSNYGILLATMDRKSSRKSPLTEVLGHVSCPILLCW